MKKTYKFCQSCSMPIAQDPKKGGSNKDGSKNHMYCSFCYEKGEFLGRAKTARQMQDLVIGFMKEKGVPGPLAWLMTRGIPRLERWKQ